MKRLRGKKKICLTLTGGLSKEVGDMTVSDVQNKECKVGKNMYTVWLREKDR